MKASYIKKLFLGTINSMKDNISAFVKHPGVDFTRTRKCPFTALIRFILTLECHSLNHELSSFFCCDRSGIPSRSAFIQQRDKLNDAVFPSLFSELNKKTGFKRTFHGFHILACDGSDVNIPPFAGDKTTIVASNTPGVTYHQMHLNAMYDVLEERYSDVIIQPRAKYNERAAFISFLERNPVPGKCIFLADRGYFSLNVLAHLLRSGQFFVCRMNVPDSGDFFLKRFDMPESEVFDTELEINVTRNCRKAKNNPKQYVAVGKNRRFDFIPADDKESVFTIPCRLVKVRLTDGNYEYLITNLPNKGFDAETIKELYRLRWGIETSFRVLKYNVSLNSFHSIRRDFITQEIYARLIIYNLTMSLVHSVAVKKKDTKYQYKISVSAAVITCRDYLIHKIRNGTVISELLRHLTPIRPGRKYVRKKRSKRYVPLTNRA